MSRAVGRKERPLSMRLSEAEFAIIDRAATLRGRSREDFVREVAVRAAEDELMGMVPIRMNPSGFKAFMATLSGPAASVPEMVELFRRAAPWEAGADVVGSVDGLPRDLSARTKKYLKSTGYGDKRAR